MLRKKRKTIRTFLDGILILFMIPFSIQTDAIRNTQRMLPAEVSDRPQEYTYGQQQETSQVEALLEKMSLDEKIGQVMMVGFDGYEMDDEMVEMIKRYHIGGVILVSRNISDPEGVVRLTNQLQAETLASGHPGLLIAIDEEGGRVARLRQYRGFTEFPSAMAITATDDVENAFQVGRSKADELKSLGINTNLAPVLDVNNNPVNPVIGIRSFSSDVQLTATYGVAMMQGMQSEGVIAVGKHFPGHGDTSVDSHLFLPVVPYDIQRLRSIEFVPFEAAMQAGIAGIMSAHIRFPAIDATPGLAATLSPAVLTGLLRRQMGYDGLLFTDSLEMGALAMSGYPATLAAAKALQSGADVLLFDRNHNDQIAAFQLIREWVISGKIPEERLDEAVGRILRTKIKFELINPALMNENASAHAIDVDANRELASRIAEESITLLRDEDGLLPLRDVQNILFITLPGVRGLGTSLGADEIYVSNLPAREEIDYIDAVTQMGYDTVVLCTANIQLYPGQTLLAHRLLHNGVPLVIASLSSPYDLMYFPEAGTYLASYGANPPSRAALAAVLTGELLPGGHLPVEIPGLYHLGDGMNGFVTSPSDSAD